MRRPLPLLAATAAALGLAACGSSSTSSTSGSAAKPSTNPTSASLMITHVANGCHTWADRSGAPGAPSATLHVAPGGTVSITNNDVMPHMLKAVSAAGVVVGTPAMNHLGAKTTLTVPTRPGVYTFTTKAGEDYSKGVTTTGPDNTLRLKVIVA